MSEARGAGIYAAAISQPQRRRTGARCRERGLCVRKYRTSENWRKRITLIYWRAHRKIERNPFEPARELARALQQTARYQQSRRDRKKVEMLFAHMKRILRVDRLRLRGRSGAKDEFLLTAIAQNLRRLALTFSSRLTEPIPPPA